MRPREAALTERRVKELLDYNPNTGIFTWRVSRGPARAGDIAGGPNNKGYHRVKIDGLLHCAQRLAWLYIYGAWPEDQVDHINCVRDDNRIENLRAADNAENQGNRRKARSDSSTGVIGATWHPRSKKFQAMIRAGGKQKYLGLFNTAEEAHQAYIKAKRELHPFCTI